MDLTLIVTESCAACIRAEKILRKISKYHKEISLKVVDINNYKRKEISIVPALLINDKLFSYGDIQEDKLLFTLQTSKV